MKDSMHGSNNVHPADILNFVCAAGEAAALVVVTGTRGGGIRAPGAMMGVTASGKAAGYISNGCVDADVVLAARQAIETGAARTLTYGEGSPFLDIQLPCGGRLDLFVLPLHDSSVLSDAGKRLKKRLPVSLTVSAQGVSLSDDAPAKDWDGEAITIRCEPRLRLRIAGRGTEPVALARLATAADMEVDLQSPDDGCLALAADFGLGGQKLTAPDIIPECLDDSRTAFVTMFHDHDWELHLLAQALRGPAFYIGALGGRRTHEWRCEALKERGMTTEEVARIHGPVGLIHGARDATMLAVSTLAEIAAASRGGQA